MDKNAIKKYAIWARNELIARIAQRALKYGISKDNIVDAYADSINGVLLSAVEKSQRQVLIAQIEAKGFEQVVEEVAYTWFNRLCAIRFMEVNGYLPNGVRVLSDEDNNFKPQILAQAINLDIEEVNMEKVYELKEANKDEELYRYLLIAQCNALHKILPYMFQKLEDYTELLLPDNLLREGSIIERLVSKINEEDFLDNVSNESQVEIIGWLYQYYIYEKHEQVIDVLHGKNIIKEDIPAATQIFTTDWVVRYILDNSLGKYWVERCKNSKLINKLKFLIIPDNGLEEIEEKIDPTNIKVFDPCVGSGHFLIYAFDVLLEIYRECGYTDKEAVLNILEKNLFGVDIDERASQLAYFAVMMKARKYHKFIFKKEVQCNIHSIVESNGVNVEHLQYFGAELNELNKNVALTQIQGLLHQMYDAKEYGSLITVDNYDWDLLNEFVGTFDISNGLSLFNASGIEGTQEKLKEIISVGKIIAQKYEIVVTNPPYLNKFNDKLKKFINDYYKSYSSDMFSIFMYRNFGFCVENGYSGFLTPNVWMFIKSYQSLREYVINNKTICSLVQMAKGAFFKEATVDVCCFVLKNKHTKSLNSYIRLENFKGDMEVQRVKTLDAIENHNCGYYYEQSAVNFFKIPGSPIAYWVSDKCFSNFAGNKLFDYAKTCQGLATADNNRFLRLWYECGIDNIYYDCTTHEESLASNKIWYPCTKGGSFRRWYGNNEYVVNWQYDGKDLKNFKSSVIRNPNYYFKMGLTWSTISSGKFSIRFSQNGFLFESKGSKCFINNDDYFYYILGLLNTNTIQYSLEVLAPTVDYHEGPLSRVPVIIDVSQKDKIDKLVTCSINLAQIDWDSFETSWDFKKHPLI